MKFVREIYLVKKQLTKKDRLNLFNEFWSKVIEKNPEKRFELLQKKVEEKRQLRKEKIL